jgi:hypothetical protein
MTEILLPVGRMIGGSMYKPQPRTGNDGKPIVNTRTGEVEQSYSFGLAIPKNPGEASWSQTAWGATIRKIGDDAYPGQSQSPTFAWKITDGDSVIPNKKNRRPCDQDGYPGNWILWFSQAWAPKLVNANGTVELTEDGAIVPGYFIEVYCNAVANKPRPGASHTPGIYLNPMAVALAAYGQRIESSSVDTVAVGFGAKAAALPVGASTTPPSAMQVPQQQPDAIPNFPSPPVAPNVAITKVMLPTANGIAYEAYIAQGWTDELLRQHGYMV